MITIMLLLASVASAADCVPGFFGSLPRDREFYYAAGSGATATEARIKAVGELAVVAGSTTGYEQDDAGSCNGTDYVLVRVEKSRADKAVSDELRIKRKAAALEPKVTALSSKVSEHDSRINDADIRIAELAAVPVGTVVINVDPSKPVVPPTRGMLALYNKELKPRLLVSLAKVRKGTAKPDDIGNIVATYNTMHDSNRLASFCRESLADEPDAVRQNPGLRLWLIEQCQRGAR